jgi:hypothetical protein
VFSLCLCVFVVKEPAARVDAPPFSGAVRERDRFIWDEAGAPKVGFERRIGTVMESATREDRGRQAGGGPGWSGGSETVSNCRARANALGLPQWNPDDSTHS